MGRLLLSLLVLALLALALAILVVLLGGNEHLLGVGLDQVTQLLLGTVEGEVTDEQRRGLAVLLLGKHTGNGTRARGEGLGGTSFGVGLVVVTGLDEQTTALEGTLAQAKSQQADSVGLEVDIGESVVVSY